MKISVITVALNPDAAFCLTAESILMQDHDDVEWVVIDGLSWAAGNAFVDRYRDAIDTYVRGPDSGVYAAMNTAWEHATGEYIVFLNAGDIFYQADSLSRMARHMSGGADVVYGDHDYADKGQHLFRRAGAADVIFSLLQAGEVERDWHGMMPCHQATFYRRTLFAQEQFDTRYTICADHDFFLRMCAQGRSLEHAGVVVCRYYGGGFSAQNAQRCRNEWAAVYSHYARDPGRVLQHFLGPKAAGANVTVIDDQALSLGGLHKWEGPYDHMKMPRFAWVQPQGVNVLLRNAAQRLTLTGLSRFVQRIEIIRDDTVIARKTCKPGPFEIVHDFEAPLPAGLTLTCKAEMADRMSPTDPRQSGWALYGVTLTERPDP